ncbi:hypothetical protein M9H77_17838 [Catharanthus roseus]|uniref:Uncharacterized protein n=1 Tax=Catharanthus roseus TaxID=4058 RepID=A0ACC0B5Q1_CATRO|nr:hypothetical protein M9H77_17838 [Catharanthus roseus]
MHTQSSANKDALEFIHEIEAFACSSKKCKNEVIYKEKRQPTADRSPGFTVVDRLLSGNAGKITYLPPTIGSPSYTSLLGVSVLSIVNDCYLRLYNIWNQLIIQIPFISLFIEFPFLESIVVGSTNFVIGVLRPLFPQGSNYQSRKQFSLSILGL